MADQGIRISAAGKTKDGQVREISLIVPNGSTVEQAAEIARAAGGFVCGEESALSVWGKKAGRSQRVRGGDRIEWTEPLVIDPAEARRLRAERAAAAPSRGRHGSRHRLI